MRLDERKNLKKDWKEIWKTNTHLSNSRTEENKAHVEKKVNVRKNNTRLYL